MLGGGVVLGGVLGGCGQGVCVLNDRTLAVVAVAIALAVLARSGNRSGGSSSSTR